MGLLGKTHHFRKPPYICIKKNIYIYTYPIAKLVGCSCHLGHMVCLYPSSNPWIAWQILGNCGHYRVVRDSADAITAYQILTCNVILTGRKHYYKQRWCSTLLKECSVINMILTWMFDSIHRQCIVDMILTSYFMYTQHDSDNVCTLIC